jgi:hypothetical protein
MFSRAQFERRVARAREAMAHSGILVRMRTVFSRVGAHPLRPALVRVTRFVA